MNGDSGERPFDCAHPTEGQIGDYYYFGRCGADTNIEKCGVGTRQSLVVPDDHHKGG
jgi:hypothetical protein